MVTYAQALSDRKKTASEVVCDYMDCPLGKEIVKHAEGALE